MFGAEKRVSGKEAGGKRDGKEETPKTNIWDAG